MSYNTMSPRAEYTSGVSQDTFPFAFKIYLKTDIKVFQTLSGVDPDDEADLLTLTVDYTVTINGDAGGAIELVTPAASGDAITLLRNLDIDRQIEYQTSGDLLAETLNDDQEYQTYLIADAEEKTTRNIKLPENVQGVDNTLPAPIAESYLRWNTDANALENDTTLPTNVQLAVDSAAAALVSENAASDSADDSATSAGESAASATAAELFEWEAEAERLTADSYATEAEDVEVNLVTSDGDGTFTYTPTTDFSALHWAAKSAASSQGAAENISADTTNFDGLLSASDTDVQKALETLDDVPIAISTVASNVLLNQDSAVLTYTATADDVTTTTADYVDTDYVYDTSSGLLYDCILASTTGILLTNATYFTLISSNDLEYTASLHTFTDGLGAGGFVKSLKTSTKSIDFTGVSDGLKYTAEMEDDTDFDFGSVGGERHTNSLSAVSFPYMRSVGLYDKESADDNRLIFDSETGKHYLNGNVSGVAGEMATLGDETPAISFNPYPIMVASETPMDIRTDEPKIADNVMKDLEIQDDLTVGGILSANNLLHIQDQKSSGIQAGTSVVGQQTRVLNTVLANTISGASLATNIITLPAGDYYIEASSPVYKSNSSKIRLRNITDATTEIVGTSEWTGSGDSVQANSFLHGKITITSTKTFDIQHYITFAGATNGLGVGNGSGDVEVYSEIRIWKVG